MQFIRQFREHRRQKDFERRIERYRSAVLEPRLGVRSLGALIRKHGKRRTHAALSDGGVVILKFHFEKTAGARVSLDAQPLLESRGIPLAPIVHADAAKNTLNKYGLACVAYERIEGETMRLDRDAALVPEIARMLARMHSDLAPEAGRLHKLRPAAEGWTLLEEELSARLARVAALPLDGAKQLAARLREFFAPGAARPGDAPGGWSLVHNDMSPHNILVRPGGGFVLLDLDLCARGLYGFELAHALVRFAMTPDRRSEARYPLNYLLGDRELTRGFVEAYGAAAPGQIRADWERWSEWYVLWDLLDAVATTAGDLAGGRKPAGDGGGIGVQAGRQMRLLEECLAAARRRA